MAKGTPLLFVAALVVGARCAAGVPATFTAGDLYLVSPSIDSPVQRGLVRIDPFTWSASVVNAVNWPVSMTATGVAHDALRDRLWVHLYGGHHWTLVDASANEEQWAMTWPVATSSSLVAPTPAGRVYFYSGIGALGYADAPGAITNVLGPGGQFLGIPNARGVLYDAGRNALFLTTQSSAHRVDLSADGTAFESVMSSTPYPFASGAASVGLSVGAPIDTYCVVFDDNTDDSVFRMALLLPDTLGWSPWATNGPYVGAAATSAGTYSNAVGSVVVILDTHNNVLRTYPQGGFGDGTIVVSGLVSSAGGSGENARMVTIRAAPDPGDLNGDGMVNGADLAILLGGWGPCPAPPEVCPGDINGDGVVDGVDLALLLGGWG